MKTRLSTLFFFVVFLFNITSEATAQPKKILGYWALQLMVQNGDTVFDRAQLNLKEMVQFNVDLVKKERNLATLPERDSLSIAIGVEKRIHSMEKIFLEFVKDSIYYSTVIESGEHEGKKEGGFFWLNEEQTILFMREKSKQNIKQWDLILGKKELLIKMDEVGVQFVMQKIRRKKN
jgi:hypothetical protein